MVKGSSGVDPIEIRIARTFRQDMERHARWRSPGATGLPAEAVRRDAQASRGSANVNLSSTQVNFGHFTDEEMDLFDKLLKKAVLPEQLLHPAPIDLEGEQPPTDGGQWARFLAFGKSITLLRDGRRCDM
jgi:hypothetical protein